MYDNRTEDANQGLPLFRTLFLDLHLPYQIIKLLVALIPVLILLQTILRDQDYA